VFAATCPITFKYYQKPYSHVSQASWVLNIVVGKVNRYLYLCALLLGDESSREANKFVSNSLGSGYMIITQCNKAHGRYPIQYKEKNTHVIVASVFHKKPPHFQVDIYQNLTSYQYLSTKHLMR
jgi:hypothetical protein